MQNISITFQSQKLSIPLNYQYGIQSLIYNLLGKDWHDSGVFYGERKYKLFTFSSLRGKKKIANGKITFEDLIYLDVRGVRDDFCTDLRLALDTANDLTLLGQNLFVKSVKCNYHQIDTDTICVKMLSPLTIHKTENGKTFYYTPLDSEFSKEIDLNFRRKYAAFTGRNLDDAIKIVPVNVGVKDKYVTTFKNTRITAWRGEYQLFGKQEYLNFLYYCGLGARNSEGFGMFELI